MNTTFVEPKWETGNNLCTEDQKYVLSAYCHRFTKEHKPAWANTPRENGQPYRPQYKTDAEWLASTTFRVKANGRVDRHARYCESNNPTWPDGQ